MGSWSPTKGKTRNRRSFNIALKPRGSLSIWFGPEMGWGPSPSAKHGRQQWFSDAPMLPDLLEQSDRPLKPT